MISAVLTGHEQLIPYVRKIYPNTQAALEESVGQLALKLVRKIREEKLTDQQLKNRTGALRNSISQRIDTSGSRITAVINTRKPYAMAHEFGFTGTVTVKEHMRQIRQAFGKPISPVNVRVRTHTMHMHLPERSFLRSSLREMETEIKAGMRDALKGALA